MISKFAQVAISKLLESSQEQQPHVNKNIFPENARIR